MGIKGTVDLTPAMRQYMDIKEQYSDCILFFRMGDFYEMFFEDAVIASQALEITLTSRNKNKEGAIPLCGVPYHAASAYIAKLIDKGFKVAICEQVEDPKLAKGVVRREVVRVVTPGLVVDPDNLDAKENNFLGAVAADGETLGLACLDISTGEFRVTESRDKANFLAEAAGYHLREVLIPEDLKDRDLLALFSGSDAAGTVNRLTSDYFRRDDAAAVLTEFFGADTLKAAGLDSRPAAAAAAGAALRYAVETQKEHLGHITGIERYETDHFLIVDEIAKANLELFSTIAGRSKKGSLFQVIDETVTAMGGRKLRNWLSYPLVSPERIAERLGAVGDIKEHHLVREGIRKVLGSVYDMERLGARIAMGVANARDLTALGNSLRALPEIKRLTAELTAPAIVNIKQEIDEMPDVKSLIERSIADDPPLTIREGGMIREGFDAKLDEIVAVTRDGRKWIAALEEKERKRTGINSLKVGYNSVFGYYIEISKARTEAIPGDYVRKQTLVNAERYINEELKGYEQTVLHAEDRRQEREYELFLEIRNAVAAEIRRLQITASRIAELDALASLAEVAEKNHYVRPAVDDGDRIDIRDGRHPVVEKMNLTDGFVPNDVVMDMDRNRFLIITGPNMAGKSTFIRQVALIVLMAQMGSFVPAAEAHIGIVDRIFTRIGAADNLSRGQSTFMVEMNEVANILIHATPRSLIILDEVGRGTSTFDGLSIAWAVAEYIHDAAGLGSRTLFATHYHQLMELALTKDGVKNYNIAVKEWGDRIIFLRKIMEGGTNRSYGIQVARIAGVPDDVIVRAKEVLANLEKGELDAVGLPKIAKGKKDTPNRNKDQLSLFRNEDDDILEEIADLDIMTLSPLEAMNRINVWKERLGKKKPS